jgi:5-methyltetrahydropteroyltriglutamate--homocysteine methyltransferase
VRDVVAEQLDCGIDVVNDGEQGKVGFQTYIPQRMSGFGGEAHRPVPSELTTFPKYAQTVAARFALGTDDAVLRDPPAAVSDVHYETTRDVEEDCEVLLQALREAGHTAERAFLTAPSPGIVATTMTNQYYESYDAYVRALARELRTEYAVIIDSGLTLQIDAPDLAMERGMYFQDRPLTEFLEAIELHIDALNSALEGFPVDRIRLHCCWGNLDSPHVHDVELAEVLPIISRANVGALGIPFGNPRHQHEIDVIAKAPLPEHMTLIAGVVDTTTNYVEHPEVVSRRIQAAVQAVGDISRIIASPDCGFGTFAGYEFVAADVVSAKLKALRDGADLAAHALASHPPAQT